MNIVGIVAEYNPFHNGHAYQIKKAQELTGCDHVIVAMSGDFVQRGTPAIIDKEVRTQLALANGADMVLQIPVCYSTASAEAFAYGSVALLAAAGIDTLVFGCETSNVELLKKLAHLYVTEPETYKDYLVKNLKNGLSFPEARSNATIEYLNATGEYEQYKASTDDIRQLLEQPNNILGIEYLKALHRLNTEGRLTKTIEVCPIPRIGTGYHSTEVSNDICSATALRQRLCLNEEWTSVVPSNCVSIMKEYLDKNPLVLEDAFSLELRYAMLLNKEIGYASFLDGNEDISNRILNTMDSFEITTTFCKQLQTKDTTYARMSRLLLHILLGITAKKLSLVAINPVPYIRVLGFDANSSSLLSYISEQTDIPLLVNMKNASQMLSLYAFEVLKMDLFARELYLTKINGKNDYQMPVKH